MCGRNDHAGRAGTSRRRRHCRPDRSRIRRLLLRVGRCVRTCRRVDHPGFPLPSARAGAHHRPVERVCARVRRYDERAVGDLGRHRHGRAGDMGGGVGPHGRVARGHASHWQTGGARLVRPVAQRPRDRAFQIHDAELRRFERRDRWGGDRIQAGRTLGRRDRRELPLAGRVHSGCRERRPGAGCRSSGEARRGRPARRWGTRVLPPCDDVRWNWGGHARRRLAQRQRCSRAALFQLQPAGGAQHVVILCVRPVSLPHARLRLDRGPGAARQRARVGGTA